MDKTGTSILKPRYWARLIWWTKDGGAAEDVEAVEPVEPTEPKEMTVFVTTAFG